MKTAPTLPGWLKGEALAEWKRVVPELTRLRLISRLDRGTLARYCSAWEIWIRACKTLDERGLIVGGYRGVRTKNAAWQIYRESTSLVAESAEKLGLTLASRARMHVSESPDSDPFFD